MYPTSRCVWRIGEGVTARYCPIADPIPPPPDEWGHRRARPVQTSVRPSAKAGSAARSRVRTPAEPSRITRCARRSCQTYGRSGITPRNGRRRPAVGGAHGIAGAGAVSRGCRLEACAAQANAAQTTPTGTDDRHIDTEHPIDQRRRRRVPPTVCAEARRRLAADGSERHPSGHRCEPRVRRHLGLHRPDRATGAQGQGRCRADARHAGRRLPGAPRRGVRLGRRPAQVGRRRAAADVRRAGPRAPRLPGGLGDAGHDRPGRSSPPVGRDARPAYVGRDRHRHVPVLPDRQRPSRVAHRGSRDDRDADHGGHRRRRRDRHQPGPGRQARAVVPRAHEGGHPAARCAAGRRSR